jgi:nucleotide-binding universal stress UspA family protein
MGRILCATRGGVGSYKTQDAAAALAKQRGDELLFIYVVDTTFLNHTAAPLVVDVEARLAKMGRFQLTMAQERAAAQGVQAQTLVRRGPLRTELSAAARELAVDLIVLGRPVDQGALFDQDALQSLASTLEREAGIEVLIL